MAQEARFCSHVCFNLHQKAHSKKIQRVCEHCGAHFQVFPSLFAFFGPKAGRFCSIKCRWDEETNAKPASVRFWKFVKKTDECWLWTGGRVPRGYGHILIAGKTLQAHRFSWELHYGPIPKGLKVCHKCDNPPCVRPDHLFVGTTADNSADMISKGRQVKGARCHTAKLTAEQVLEIRASGMTQRQITTKYGISQSHASAILLRTSWKHL